jgi:hypothetical protein
MAITLHYVEDWKMYSRTICCAPDSDECIGQFSNYIRSRFVSLLNERFGIDIDELLVWITTDKASNEQKALNGIYI